VNPNISLTEHFFLSEVTHSDTASRLKIDNSLPPELVGAVIKTAVGMEKVRASLGNLPISISSWYRCLALNAAVRSKPTSQHIKGEAVDFTCPSFGSPLQVCKHLMEFKDLIRWDQLILEHTWVHISWNSIPSSSQRGEVLSLLSTGGYATGLTSANGEPYVA
jgi:zinc D-Ala-D-Ala carboxypeptidase